MSTNRRWLRWLRGAFACSLLMAMLGTGGWYYEHTVKPARHRAMCKSHLKQLLTALHSYHDLHDCFPPAYTLGKDDERWHSWRVLILPQLGERELFAAYRFDEPWNGPHNSKLSRRMPAVFGFPGESPAKFLAVTGRNTAWPEYLSSRIREFTGGTSNGIMLVESADSDVNWLEPRHIPFRQAMKRRVAPAPPRLNGRYAVTTIGMADGTTRTVYKVLTTKTLAELLGVGPTGADLPHNPKREPPPPVFPPQRDASSFAKTDVLPYPSIPLTRGHNYVYCATFRIAWDGLRNVPGERVAVKPMPIMAAELNRLPFPLGNLDPESYLAMRVDRAHLSKITDELQRRFPGAPGPTKPPAATEGKGRVIFAALIKSLPFAAEFDSQPDPLPFPDGPTTSQVACFGRLAASSANFDAAEQVRIADYCTDEDFVIELKTESKRDVMLLAKVPPEPTLQETIDTVLKRVASPNPQHKRFTLEGPEDLLIPKLSFNILKTYQELLGIQIVDSPIGNALEPEIIINATQATAFVLNERGAELESVAEIGTMMIGEFDGTPTEPPKIRKFLFDRPFLVLLRETQSREPYLVLWIENAELMEPFRKELGRP